MARVKKVPQRMCVGCRQMKDKKALIRIVRTPEGQILIDPTGKKSGRGAYICPSAQCFKAAVKTKALNKALEQEIPPEVIETLKKELVGD